jgi:hypothetical protein
MDFPRPPTRCDWCGTSHIRGAVPFLERAWVMSPAGGWRRSCPAYANGDGSDFGIAIVGVNAAPGARRVPGRGIKIEGEMLGLLSLAIVAAIALVGCSEAPNKGPCPSGYVESGNWRVDGGTCVRASSHAK